MEARRSDARRSRANRFGELILEMVILVVMADF